MPELCALRVTTSHVLLTLEHERRVIFTNYKYCLRVKNAVTKVY